MLADKPAFIHDCNDCIFLGRFKDYDIYYCHRCDGGTLIARWGDSGPRYRSCPLCLIIRDFKDSKYILHEAYVLFKDKLNQIISEKKGN